MANLRPIYRAAVALSLLAVPVWAQQAADPANLTGERVAARSPADTLAVNHGAAALQQLLLKLRTRASMMLIVAHPDDEDGGFLAYESRGQGARVAMLTLTRGEGGQNLMSADFDDALGLIRTQELLGADRFLGVDQFFGTEVDFGFSKTKEETLAKWTHNRVLYDAVRCVRLYRPLVIASVFVGGPTDGHGHHQVAGEIAQEVFNAAADPKVFPEMGLAAWAPLKVYARVPFSRVTGDGMYDYATGKTIPVLFHNYVTGLDTRVSPVATVQIHQGDAATVMGKPALGMEGLSYVQFARKGLALQKTQIGQGVRLAPAGKSDTGYTLMGTRLSKKQETEQTIYDGIDVSLAGIAELVPSRPELKKALIAINAQLAEAQQRFDPEHLEAVVPELRRTLQALTLLTIAYSEPGDVAEQQRLNVLHELRVKKVQANDALALALGLTLTATVENAGQPLISPLRAAKVKVHLSNASGEAVNLLPADYPDDTYALKEHPLTAHSAAVVETTMSFPGGLGATRPYFSRPNLQQPYYDVADAGLRNAPGTPAPLVVSQLVDVNGTRLRLEAVVTDERDVTTAVVVPPLSVALEPTAGIVRRGDDFFVVAKLRLSGQLQARPKVRLDVPGGWQYRAIEREDPRTDEPSQVAFRFQVAPASVKPGTATVVTADAVLGMEHGVQHIKESFRVVGYPGVVPTNFYTPATYKAVAVDVTTAPGLRVAYLPGTGDDVVAYLPNLGVTPVTIGMKDVTTEGLKDFDAVVLGVRAYAAHPGLAGKGSGPLLTFAKNGGVVITQYMTARFGDAESPYTINVPGDPAHNVVVEAQPVTVVAPAAALLNWPNKITVADFQGWTAEYGHGFAASWGPEFEPMIEVHDPDQDPQKGGLLVAKVGKGAYIYCALALYRQLPEGVPGAYRLYANLLSYAKNPKR